MEKFQSERRIKWRLVVFFVISHILALLGVYKLLFCSTIGMAVSCFMWYYLSGTLGITAGAHRLWSHESYGASTILRILLMVANSIANQGSIIWWARDHKIHHRNTDTVGDPYNINEGFFFAHMGWIFVEKHPKVIEDGAKINLDRLKSDSVVMFQHRTDPYFRLACCFILPMLYGYMVHNTIIDSLLILGFFRWIFTMHCTWCINSVAHMWGYRPYDQSIEARENKIASAITAGEGYHNYHHVYPYDYRCAEGTGFDPLNFTTSFINLMAFLGLAHGLRSGPLNKPR